jgi:hypothetical protein
MPGSRYKELKELLDKAVEEDDQDMIDIIEPELEQLEPEDDDD